MIEQIDGKCVIIKPMSLGCNQRCEYCYNFSAPFRDHRVLPRMTLETMERVHWELATIVKEWVRYVWHGGEPLLRGLPFFQHVVDVQRAVLERYPDLKIENGVQTNCTRMTSEWVAFFKEHRFSMGTSIDGPADLHNRFRRYPDGSGTFDDAMRGFRMLRDGDVSAGYIAVVTQETLKRDPAEMFDAWIAINPKFEISPCWEPGSDDTAYAIDPVAFLEFCKELFDIWWARDDPNIRIRLFHGFLQGVLGGKEQTCNFTGRCSGFMAIEADGGVYPCGKFSGMEQFRLGNINEIPLSDILSGDQYNEWLAIRTQLPKQCRSCQWSKVCHNGCTYDRYLGDGTFAEHNPLCVFTKGMFDHVSDRVEALRASRKGSE